MTNPGEADSLQSRRVLLQVGFSAGDLDALDRLIADDVIWRAAGQAPWVGRTEVLAHLAGFFDRFDYQFRLESTGLDSDGLRAVERSNFVSRVATEKGPLGPPHSGSVVIIWARQDEWRVAAYLDIGAPLFA